MKNKIPLIVGGLILFIVLATVGFLVFDTTPEPEVYVQKITRENVGDFFFEKVIDRIPAEVNITPYQVYNTTLTVGVSTDTDKLHFGVLVKNMSVRKFLNLRNDDVLVKVCVIPYGKISRFITVSPDEFILESGESNEVMLEFNADMLGNYTGEVDVITKKPKYGFLNPLLPFIAC